MKSRPTVVLVLSGLLAGSEHSWLREFCPPVISRLAEQSEVFRLQGGTGIQELIGLNPERYPVQGGPLTVAALGFDPPARSVQFHLSLLSLDGTKATRAAPAPEELAIIHTLAAKLNTSSLTVVTAKAPEMGLVWENGSLDLETTMPSQFGDRPLAEVLPRGDGEPMLRRFIDDSINILLEQEFNHEREQEGLPLLNLLWPSGQGMRPTLPNLALDRGRAATFSSSSFLLHGLTKLVGYRHSDPHRFGRGTAIHFESINADVVWIREFGDFVRDFLHNESDDLREQYGWLLRELDRRYLAPIAERENPPTIAVLAPGSHGLGFIWDPERRAPGRLPFDERALEEPATPREFGDVMDHLLR